MLDYEVPNLLEFTFIRKDRLKNLEKISNLPHKLDKNNVVQNPDIILPEYWFK